MAIRIEIDNFDAGSDGGDWTANLYDTLDPEMDRRARRTGR